MIILNPNDPVLIAANSTPPVLANHHEPAGDFWRQYSTAATVNAVQPMTTQRRAASDYIDALAEQARLRFITGGSGQALVYQAKKDEAAAFMAANVTADVAASSKDDRWPFLSAEAGITAPTLLGVAKVILDTAQQWIVVAALIEQIRLQAKDEISKVNSSSDLNVILAKVAFPVP